MMSMMRREIAEGRVSRVHRRLGVCCGVVALLAGSLLLASCGESEPANTEVNLLVDGGFERGGQGWASMETAAWSTGFSVTDSRARTGERSAHLKLRSSDKPENAALIAGAKQEFTAERMPETIRGAYYVESWKPGIDNQYIQCVVIVWGARNKPASLRAPNHQVRFLLAGPEEPPFALRNGKFLRISGLPPKQGEWVPFELDVREAFRQAWGQVPVDFEKIVVFVETRYDGRTPDDPACEADVYFDDMEAIASPPLTAR